ncbi:All-trans-phytoene synthase [Gemmata obscuriglobus]|uniref:Squalene synthase HpnC n=1 Tax=Gemmata obscuriglobus TaxID=114 RepID=A0A2Z3GSW4_9BACT|nr:squalene synthase HpnC [Gemmata obscuriglobus]AWM36863.1 squalene synthase HpnC [Gemmata obscuriglobus]QEG30465.1 All-trans-phytoene synthase [Gemmata obscuriglobus]VTS09789.1 squalene synthase : Squalene synthase HpnC OS=Chthonomonas calidirosea (strain DSM 23976 / ICMP 18418 / T49) GN=CCALI_02219 PE=4 SV=1: SQS_PSY [Gemmata obscuriglobus UQM 2246]
MTWDFARELARWGPGAPAALRLSDARAYCAGVARSHYENFTVVSLLLPRRLVKHFHAVYAYCRWSDDLADETAGGQTALDLIAWWRRELMSCYEGEPRHPVMLALRETVRRFDIPPDPFLALLVAFEQDQRVKRYDTFEQLAGYCANSANPVGHLVLRLFECFDAERAALSDEVCTGLQLANFWQDVARDLDIGRVYLPAEDRARFGYSDEDLDARRCTPQFLELMRFEVSRARGYFARGAALLPLLPRAARVDVDLFIRGGEAILDAIERQGYDVWARRPEVSKVAKAKLLLGAAVRALV